MATQPSPPPSASNSANSAAHSPSTNQAEIADSNGVFHGDEKPDLTEGLNDLDSAHYIERFEKYEADYTRRLIAKYFSGKTLNGGNIFDEQVTIDDEVIKPSRLPCFHSYANPIVGFEEQCSNGSTPGVETPPNISNGKHIMKNG
ncbi:hypothetical protein QN277_014552 [Acacia crassicarpa]|uniref:Uncharacterized protein n=1 Tax=Acacia crassicarpa TaxID=499986 RepID=A0AAE1IP11_9FABA|nr:hypothetical protein QN277_014552 [Acacia crassicarpa]